MIQRNSLKGIEIAKNGNTSLKINSIQGGNDILVLFIKKENYRHLVKKLISYYTLLIIGLSSLDFQQNE